MSSELPRQSLLEELDARQSAVLDELDELNRRIERLSAETLNWRGSDGLVPQAAAA